MPSTARTCDKKAFPRPAPVDAPYDAVSEAVSMHELTHGCQSCNIDAGKKGGNARDGLVEVTQPVKASIGDWDASLLWIYRRVWKIRGFAQV